MPEGQPLFWRLMPSVRATERDRFLFFFQLSALLPLAQTLGLAGSEALFLERVGPADLPMVFVIAPIATVLGCGSYAINSAVNRAHLISLSSRANTNWPA